MAPRTLTLSPLSRGGKGEGKFSARVTQGRRAGKRRARQPWAIFGFPFGENSGRGRADWNLRLARTLALPATPVCGGSFGRRRGRRRRQGRGDRGRGGDGLRAKRPGRLVAR